MRTLDQAVILVVYLVMTGALWIATHKPPPMCQAQMELGMHK